MPGGFCSRVFLALGLLAVIGSAAATAAIGQPASVTSVHPSVAGRADLPRRDGQDPGMSISLGQGATTVSQSELRKGINIPVVVTVGRNTAKFHSAALDLGGCSRPDKNGLMLFPIVRRADEVVYCPECDLGYCPQRKSKLTTPQQGRHSYTFIWRGQAGNGPSDAVGSDARTFVGPGTYLLTVRLGLHDASGSGPVRYVVSPPREIRITAD